MPLKDEEKAAIAEVVEELTATVVGSGRGKRRIADLFEELVDKETWPDYYEVDTEPLLSYFDIAAFSSWLGHLPTAFNQHCARQARC